ncbi:MAG: nitronate monooxygenase family protein [Dehalococcoidia bacterium]|nr:nitronate monooxygenase [Dehalococcoidia bacterium]MCB9485036.1 nitronate monooxygenase [Thermoflexaceae bacterium]
MTGDPLHTRLCEEYGCEVPVVAFAHTRDVIVAVTNAGGIGILGAAGQETETLRASIRWIKERVGNKPWGVDLLVPASFVEGNKEDLEAMIPQGHRDFVDSMMKENGIPMPATKRAGVGLGPELLRHSREQLDLLLEEEVPIFASGLGSPAFFLERAHAQGMKVWGLVGLPRQARRQIEAGVDCVIAQGYDSGGHSGTIGTFTLVPEVVQMAEGTNTLVLAGGGISTGRQLAASIAMGADGIWTGTIWLATHESETEMFIKQRLIEAQAEDAIQSRATSGKPIRQLRSKWSDAWKAPGAPDPLPMPLQPMLVSDIQEGIRQAKMEDWMTTPAGQSVVGIHSIRPAAEVVYSLVEGAQDMFDRMSGAPAGA